MGKPQSTFEEQSLRNVEDRIAPVREVFRLQNADELIAAETRYLPGSHGAARAIILAASRGAELGDLTQLRPKTMVPVAGQPLMHRLVAQFRGEQFKDVTVIRGFAREQVNAPDVRFVENEEFEGTGELLSLSKTGGDARGVTPAARFQDLAIRRLIPAFVGRRSLHRCSLHHRSLARRR